MPGESSLELQEKFSPEEVLDRLYEEISSIGTMVREIEEGEYVLAQDSDWHRTDRCRFDYKGKINELQPGKGFIVTRGHSSGFTNLSHVQSGILYSKIEVGEPSETEKELKRRGEKIRRNRRTLSYRCESVYKRKDLG